MRKTIVILGILAVLAALVISAGCVSTSSTTTTTTTTPAAPTASSQAQAQSNLPSIAGDWQITKCAAHDTIKPTEVHITEANDKKTGNGWFTIYKGTPGGLPVDPVENTLTWTRDKDNFDVFNIVPQTTVDYFPTANYQLSADGKTLTGSTAVLTRVA